MTDDDSHLDSEASRLQEAVDTIVSAFDHPEMLDIRYSALDDRTETHFEIERDGDTETYRLQYDPRDDSSEPEIIHVE